MLTSEAVMSHKYEIVHVDTCKVIERFNDLGLAQEETDLINRHKPYGRHDYLLCEVEGFPVPEWPCTLQGEHKANKPAPVVEPTNLPGESYCDARR